jgi:hypothetical protein
MSDDLGKQIGKLWKGFRDKTAETVARQEAAYVRGKIAGTTITDDAGNVIVDAGHRIDDAAIQRAEKTGKLHALIASVSSAQFQDLKEKAKDQMDHSQDGTESRNFNSIEEYAKARIYVGHIAGVDVTDIRGAVLIPAGTEISENDVRAAREAGLLSALVYAAQQPYTAPEPPPTVDGDGTPTKPAAKAAGPTKRASLPFVNPDKDKKA